MGLTSLVRHEAGGARGIGTAAVPNLISGVGVTAESLPPPGAAAGAGQTLNYVKALLLTSQFSRAIHQIRSQDRCLYGPALHLALALHRTGTLEVFDVPEISREARINILDLVSDYSCNFNCREQLKYFCLLDLTDRVKALQRLLLSGAGVNNELVGYIDAGGNHQI